MLITEGKATIEASSADERYLSKKLPVFYNPNMQINRDISIALVNALNKPLEVLDLLAGSGIRGIRFLLECPQVKSVHFEDIKTKTEIENNCKLNKVRGTITNNGANITLLNSKGFDYIDIDPFGSPNPYLDAACKRIRKGGILAITATDTSALCGTYINACKRKYWAIPLHNYLMNEVGIRILIRKVQLIAAQYDKAPVPIFSHATRHYMRVYFRIEKGKEKVNQMLKQHQGWNKAGPMWLGQLWDKNLVKKMSRSPSNISDDSRNLLEKIRWECEIPSIGFYDIHAVAEREKISPIPKKQKIINEIEKKKFKVFPSHFSKYGLRTEMEYKEFVDSLK